MPKFFVPADEIRGDSILLHGAQAEHLKVLRVRPGEELLLCDGVGTDYLCSIETVSGNTWHLSVISRQPSEGEPDVLAAVYAGLPKGDKTETIIQKAVELGADRIVFFLSSRCVSRPDEKSMKGKLERWQKIAEAAAMQSYRGKIPQVCWLSDFNSMLQEAAKADLKAFLWEGEKQVSLRKQMQMQGRFYTAALISGPEGGFSDEEAKTAEAFGIPALTLGKRILRCETAPLCALSALMFYTGNME